MAVVVRRTQCRRFSLTTLDWLLEASLRSWYRALDMTKPAWCDESDAQLSRSVLAKEAMKNPREFGTDAPGWATS